MKIRIDMECTPEEARAFFGLPDIKPLHDTWTEEMQGRVREGVAALDVEALLNKWMPAGSEMFEQMQKTFWSSFGEPGKGEPGKGE